MPLPLKTFKLYAPTMICSRSTDGRLRIEGIASSSIVDRHGDQLTLKALRKMEASAIGMTIFMNHEYRVPQDVFGTVEKARLVKSGEKDEHGEAIWDLRFGIGVASSNEQAVKTFELIETDQVKLGLSIGAMIPEGGAKIDKAKGAYIVDDVDLVETSVISIPANPRAWVDYMVKAFTGHLPDRLGAERRKALMEGDEAVSTEETTDETEETTEQPAASADAAATDTTESAGDEEAPEGETTTKGWMGVEAHADFLKAAKAKTHTHGHAHDHNHEHEHGYEGSSDHTIHIHDHAHVHSHDHAPDHEHNDTQNDWQHNHGHSGGYETDHPHDDGTSTKKAADEPATGELTPDATKTRVTVWDDEKTIEVDTGRRAKADSSQSAQDESSETAGGSTAPATPTQKGLIEGGETGSITLKAVLAQLTAARARTTEVEAERDAAIVVAKNAMDNTATILTRIGELPMGRKTGFVEVKKDFDDLQGIYDDDVRRLMTKGATPHRGAAS